MRGKFLWNTYGFLWIRGDGEMGRCERTLLKSLLATR